jgi:hypothetical protein
MRPNHAVTTVGVSFVSPLACLTTINQTRPQHGLRLRGGVSWSRHVPGHQATGLLAPRARCLAPRTLAITLCCGVRNIPYPAGSNAVFSLTLVTCELINFRSRLSLSRPLECL